MRYPIEDRWSPPAPHGAQTRPVGSDGVPCYRRAQGYAPFFRSDRYFTVGHEWYVIKREGGHLGPYLSRDEAEYALAKHVAVLLDLAGDTGRLLDPEQAGPATAFERRVSAVLARWRRGVAGENATASPTASGAEASLTG